MTKAEVIAYYSNELGAAEEKMVSIWTLKHMKIPFDSFSSPLLHRQPPD